MSEALKFFALQLSLLAVVLVLHTYVGLHIVRRTLIFSDLVLDQLAAFGVLVGIGIGAQYGTPLSYVVSMGFVLFGALLLTLINPRARLVPREAVIGIIYAMALVATLLLGDKIPRGGERVQDTLVGKMSWIGWELVVVTVATYAVLLALLWVFHGRLASLVGKKEVQPSDRIWDFFLFLTQGIITVLIVPIAGVMLAYAFLMIPATIAAMFTDEWGLAVLLGWGAGFVACVIGIFSAYHLELPYGPSLVLALGAFFAVAVVVRALLPQHPSAGKETA
jgi:zinc/manganese transport system permease protein